MQQPHQMQRGTGLSPTDPSLLAKPLDFFSEDHLRERQVCAMIDALADATTLDRDVAVTVLRVLNEEMNVHLRDEVEDLFPLLVQRCPPEDAIDTAINRIRADQGAAMGLLPAVRVALESCMDTGCDLSARQRATLRRFAGHVRRHIAAETAILLPIARARLTRADLLRLSEHMRSRRGLPPVAESSDAD